MSVRRPSKSLGESRCAALLDLTEERQREMPLITLTQRAPALPSAAPIDLRRDLIEYSRGWHQRHEQPHARQRLSRFRCDVEPIGDRARGHVRSPGSRSYRQAAAASDDISDHDRRDQRIGATAERAPARPDRLGERTDDQRPIGVPPRKTIM